MTIDRDALIGRLILSAELIEAGERYDDIAVGAALRTAAVALSAVPVEGEIDWSRYIENQETGGVTLAPEFAVPVEGDREALGFLIRDIYRERGMWTKDQDLADAILAAGFSRSPLPVEGDRETGSLFNENPRDEVRLDENRRAVRVSPLPVEGEVEWEYGCRSSAHRQPVVLDPMLDKPEDHEWDCPSPAIVRRRKAGPWEVAP